MNHESTVNYCSPNEAAAKLVLNSVLHVNQGAIMSNMDFQQSKCSPLNQDFAPFSKWRWREKGKLSANEPILDPLLMKGWEIRLSTWEEYNICLPSQLLLLEDSVNKIATQEAVWWFCKLGGNDK